MGFVDKLLAPFRRGTRLDAHRPGSYVEIPESYAEPTWGWTLDSVMAALRALADGDLDAGQRLMMAMMRDPIIAHGVETRAETLTQIPFKFVRPTECPEWFFEAWVNHWPRCLPASAHQEASEFRIVLGLAPGNVTWAPEPERGRIWLPQAHVKQPSNLTWRPLPPRYYFNGLDGEHEVEPDGQQWVFFQRAGKRPHLRGAALPLAVAWFTHQEALRQWPSRNRSHGKAQRLLEVPADQRESEDVRKLVAQAQNMLAGGVLIMPKYKEGLPNFDFKLISEQGNQTGATFENLIRLCDEYKTLVLLGATENTQGSSASDAKARTHDRVTLRKVKADAKSSEETIYTLARCCCRVNGFPSSWAPRPVFEADPPEDEAIKAERQERKASGAAQLGGFLEKVETINEKRTARGEKPIEYEADYLAEQCGVLLTRAQDGDESRLL